MRYFLLIFLLLLTSCSNPSFLFQKQIPTSNVELNHLLDTVPAFRSAFSGIDIPTFNTKLSSFLNYDPDTALFALNSLVYLMKTEPQLPMLIDDASGILQQILDYYDDPEKVKELDGFSNLLKQSEDIDPYLALDVTQKLLKKVARITRVVGSKNEIFQNTSTNQFQNLDTWQNCSVNQDTFKNNNQVFSDSTQETIQDVYTLMRQVYCLIGDVQGNEDLRTFIGSDGLLRKKTFSLEPLINTINTLDIETYANDGLKFLTEEKQTMIDAEHEAADWIIADRDKYQLVDFMIQVIYPLLLSKEKHQLMLDGKVVLDKAIGFLLQRNPNRTADYNKYLISSLIDAAYRDLKKLKDLKTIVSIDLNHPFYNNSIPLLTSSNYGAAFIFNSNGVPKETLQSMITGSNIPYQSYVTTKLYNSNGELTSNTYSLVTTNLTGMLKDSFFSSSKGLLRKINQVTNAFSNVPNQFRAFIANKFSGSISISSNYNNEHIFESIIKDIYYYVMAENHDGKKWILNRDDVNNDDQNNLLKYSENLVYSIVNLFLMKADASYPTTSYTRTLSANVNSPIVAKTDAFEKSTEAPFMTQFLYTLSGALGVLDPKEGPPQQVLYTTMRASENHDLGADGIQHVENMGYHVYTPIFCWPGKKIRLYTGEIIASPGDPNNRSLYGNYNVEACNLLSKGMYRSGKEYVLTYNMPAYEMLSPGLFQSRKLVGVNANNKDKNYVDNPSDIQLVTSTEGKFSQHQGDLTSTGSETTGWVMSQFQAFSWKGYGPYTVKGKAPNGSAIKYQNDFYTDSYKTQLCKANTVSEVGSGAAIGAGVGGIAGAPLGPLGALIGAGIGAGIGAAVGDAVGKDSTIADTFATQWEGSNKASHNGLGGEAACPNERLRLNPLGTNGQTTYFGGVNTDRDGLPYATEVNRSSKVTEGMLHMYENIYRPVSSNDPCWLDATGNGLYSYPRYGYLRPSKDNQYHKNTNCSSWQRIQIDFDSIEHAVASNLDWFINYKKHVLVVPNYAYSNLKVAANYHGASLSIFNITVGNGVAGLVAGGLAGDVKNGCKTALGNTSTNQRLCNGVWQSSIKAGHYYNMMDANPNNGRVSNTSGNGFVGELDNAVKYGVGRVTRFGRTSFEPGDSALVVDLTAQGWGFTNFDVGNLTIRSTEQTYELFGEQTFNAIQRSTKDYGKALQPLLSLPAKYNKSELLTDVSLATSENFTKFTRFFHLFFPTDDYNASGQATPDGIVDIIQKYNRSTQPGMLQCKDSQGLRVSFCLTAKEMPYIPKVEGIKYPHTYNINGTVATWKLATYTEYKLSAFIGLLIPMVSTFFSSGTITDCNNNTAPETDYSCIKSYSAAGFRAEFKNFLTAMLALNQSKQLIDSRTGTSTVALEMEYNDKSLMNLLAETGAGKRDGLIFRALSYFHPANIPSIIDDVISLAQQNYRSILGNFDILSKERGGTVKYYDQLKYFINNDPIQEGKFSSNYLGGQEPAEFLKSSLQFSRNVINDPDLYYALTTGLDRISSYLVNNTTKKPFSFSTEDTKPLLDSINSTLDTFYTPNYRGSGKNKLDYFSETFLKDFLLSKIFNNIHNLKALATEENLKEVDAYLDTNIRKQLFALFVGDGFCGYDLRHDYDENGTFDNKLFVLSIAAYNQNCQLPSQAVYFDKNPTSLNNFYGISSFDPIYRGPDYLDPRYLHLDINRLAPKITEAIDDLSNSDLNNLVELLYRSTSLDVPQLVADIKNEVIDTLMNETKIDDFGVDLNENGIFEKGEYLDMNNNGKKDAFLLKEGLDYAIRTGETYLENRNGFYALKPEYIGFLTLTDELLNPYNENCIANRNSESCNYLLDTVFEAKNTYLDMFTFKASDLLATKNFVGHWLYSTENKQYTNFSVLAHERFPSMIAVFQGNLSKLLAWTAYGFKEDGFLTYMGSALKVDDKYSTLDFIRDLKTLLNTKQLREYNHYDTFWWQFADLTASFGQYVAKAQNKTWKSDTEFYNQIATIFNKNGTTSSNLFKQ